MLVRNLRCHEVEVHNGRTDAVNMWSRAADWMHIMKYWNCNLWRTSDIICRKVRDQCKINVYAQKIFRVKLKALLYNFLCTFYEGKKLSLLSAIHTCTNLFKIKQYAFTLNLINSHNSHRPQHAKIPRRLILKINDSLTRLRFCTQNYYTRLECNIDI